LQIVVEKNRKLSLKMFGIICGFVTENPGIKPRNTNV